MTMRCVAALLACLFTSCHAIRVQKQITSDVHLDPAMLGAMRAKTSESDPPAEKRFHNIEVLSGLPSSQLYSVMAFMANSLGVTCSHCHTEFFEEESVNEKQIARQMIRLTREINRVQFQGEPTVTCYTCHRGRDFPSSVPDVAQAGWQKMLAPKTAIAPLPDVGSVLSRYASAMPATAAAITHASGNITIVGGLDERREGTFELTPRDSGGYAIHATVQVPPPLERALARWQFGAIDVDRAYGEKSVARQSSDAIVVAATSDDNPPDHLTFDATTGLLQRAQSGTQTELGFVPEEIRFSDYRAAGGALAPFTIEWARGDYLITLKFTEINR